MRGMARSALRPLISLPAWGCGRSRLFKAAIIPGLGLVLHLITAEQIRSFIYRSRRKTGKKASSTADPKIIRAGEREAIADLRAPPVLT